MISEAQKRAHRKYWEKYSQRPGVKEAASKRSQEHRLRLKHDPRNVQLAGAIQSYMSENGLSVKELASRIHCTPSHLHSMLSFNGWVRSEEFSVIPGLYAKLRAIEGKGESE
jgi:hypothetical protein